jgi:predicted transcriptional regulator
MAEIGKLTDEVMLSPLQKDLIKALEKNGPMTRADIVKSVAKPRTTVYDNLVGLIQHNVVKKYSRPTNSRGRPLVFFKVTEE